MRTGDIIKHKKWKDIAFEIDSVKWLDSGVEVTSEYINLGYTTSWHLGVGVHSHVITQPESWDIMLTSEDKCKRYNKWKTLNQKV